MSKPYLVLGLDAIYVTDGFPDAEAIQREIMARGSVVVGNFSVYEDFLLYTSGIYVVSRALYSDGSSDAWCFSPLLPSAVVRTLLE